ncbi:SNF2 domain-containing protein CLASSY 3-like [Dioscorea cayenensis subsp. rotundata]|uniref:SNF2 domain-containing protein CLASSY 3-like n=1 Tax=Dioscorea cayennensis subsp. rotundata TaxID=55577 RepID=A0AB40CR85_DIOCR|nr:SNF2 domain-containing protein CLASSY 3-like [Dioscorea cayenensis subsp. rotundata]
MRGGDSMGVNAREEEISLLKQLGKAIKRKGRRAKASAIYQLLLDIIQEEREELSGELHYKQEDRSDEGPSTGKESLPLDFFFEDEVPKSTEKSENEKMMEELWADFDFVMGLNDIGSYNVQCELEDNDTAEVEADFAALCAKGKHEIYLDEQIGICCRYCSYVLLEIKHVLPSWGEHPGGRSGRKSAATKDCDSILNGFPSAVGANGGEASCAFPSGTVWDHVLQAIRKSLYPHQHEAFEFMWKNLAGGIHLDKLNLEAKSDDTGGCVIAHAPGTGKTRLAVVFIDSYLKVFPKCRPVIVAPTGMLRMWGVEFRLLCTGLPVHNLNAAEYSGSEVDYARALGVKDPRSMRLMRIVKLLSWVKAGGVLLISYCLFNQLTAEGSTKYPELSNILREKPGLLVFDEGHTPRNERSLIWKTLEKVKTEQRIILSGTLFQNNMREFYNSLRLVRPKIAQRISPQTVRICQKKFLSLDNVRDVPKWNQSMLIASMSGGSLDALNELISMIKPFMHVYKGTILEKLPGLRNCFVYLELLPLQKSILEKFMDTRNGTFEGEYKISLVSVHPSLVASCVSEKENSAFDIDFLGSLRLNPDEGVKTKFVMELVRLCQARNEKVLVFSQYIDPLVLIKEQLIKLFNWSVGREVLQMDGKISSKLRQSAIDVFNDFKSEAKVLLASMKACSEGISLVGASRVVLLDVVWNPSVERQAISRAFRLGQEKHVYTYHLITPSSGERAKHDRQNTKDHISKLVFSDVVANIVEGDTPQTEEERTSNLISKDEILSEMVDHDKLKDMFIKVYYPQMD